MADDSQLEDGLSSSIASPISRRAWLAAAGAGSLVLLGACRGTGSAALAQRGLENGSDLRWCWCGGVTDRWATVVAAFDQECDVALEVSDEDSARVGQVTQTSTAPGGVVRFQISGLRPLTTYVYRFANGAGGTAGGRFTTLPIAGAPSSFTIALGACNARTDNPVFRAIARHNPLLFMHNGDLHYHSLHTNDSHAFRAAYDAALSDPAQAALYRSCAVTYMWDDHDFGPNNASHDNPSHEAAHRVYRERVPHYPFSLQAESRVRAAPIFQAFSIGRVRFVLTDLRSEHLRERGSLLGARQRDAFLQALLAAKRDHRLVVWLSSLPWNGSDCSDAWACAAGERTLVADFIKEHRIPLCIISGDAHMVAIDDGRNTDYATGGGAPLPLFHAGALGQTGSYKGGPYSVGASIGSGHFGLMSVVDDGQTLRVSWSARNGSDGVGDRVVAANVDAVGPLEYQFEVNADGELVR